MATVTNADIALAARILGYLPKDWKGDTTGAQSTTFFTKMQHNGLNGQQFANAKEFASSMKDRDLFSGPLIEKWEKTSVLPADLKKNPNASYDLFVRIGQEGFRGQTRNLDTFNMALGDYSRKEVKPHQWNIDVGSRDIQGPQTMPKAVTTSTGVGPAATKVPTGTKPSTAKPSQSGSRGTGTGSTSGGTTPAGTPTPIVAGPTGPPPPKLPKTDAEVRDYINENYPQWAYLQDIPEVWDVVKNAARGGWSGDRTLGALQQTGWWKTTEASARLWKEEKYTDPATANDKIARKSTELKNLATANGITIPDDQLASLAEDAIRFDWDDNEITAGLGRFFKYDPDKLMGTALTVQTTIRQKARDWLVPVDDATLEKWTTQVINGEVTVDYFDGYLKQQASTLFPQLADPISRGIPPGQWMAPYVSVAAQTLGLNPDEINLTDSKWMRSINEVGPDGKRTAMNLADWEDLLKTDETYGWDKTDKGREHGANMARTLGAMFRGSA